MRKKGCEVASPQGNRLRKNEVQKWGRKIFSEISEKGLTRAKKLDIIGGAKRELGYFLELTEVN